MENLTAKELMDKLAYNRTNPEKPVLICPSFGFLSQFKKKDKDLTYCSGDSDTAICLVLDERWGTFCEEYISEGEVKKYLLQHRGIFRHFRILAEKADLHIGIAGDAARVRLDHARQDLQKGGLAGAVDADDTGLFALLQIEIHIGQKLAHAEIDG